MKDPAFATDSPLIRVGLVGRDIQRSKSPFMHEAEARAQSLRLTYRLFDLAGMRLGVDALPDILRTAQAENYAGLNVTHPCKQAVIPLLDELSEEARAIGAVNTVKFTNGRRLGFNTDAPGFAASFRRGLGGVGMDFVVQLGAGGAGAATAYAMLELGAAHLALYDCAPGRAESLVRNLAQRFDASRLSVVTEPEVALRDAHGLVHATPTGMREHPGMPVPAHALHPKLWVAEIVYFPIETQLLCTARALGCKTLDGGAMAVFQAASAFEIFTEHPADRERMLRRFAEMPGD